jgi:hypothetical protein
MYSCSFFLKEHPQWVTQCKQGAQTLTMVHKTIPEEGDNSKTPQVAPKKANSSPPPRGSEKSGCWTPMALLPPYLTALVCNPLPPFPRVVVGVVAIQKESTFPSD